MESIAVPPTTSITTTPFRFLILLSRIAALIAMDPPRECPTRNSGGDPDK